MKRQYLEALRDDIAEGRFGEVRKLPSFRELASMYECSVASIKLAVDTLQVEGLVESIHGKGTFFTDRGRVPLPRRRRQRIVGAILLHNGWLEALEAMKLAYQRKGWFLSVYDACADMQDPAKEREFLEMALREGFAGMMMVATPIAPVNTAFFGELRHKGMKITHLAYYKEDMSDESCFLLDYSAAVDLAVRRAEECGFRVIQPVRDSSHAPALKLFEKRLGLVASRVRINPAYPCQQRYTDWAFEKDNGSKERFWPEIKKELLPLADAGRNTLLLAYRAENAYEIARAFRESGLSAGETPTIWALDSLTPFNRGVDAVRYDIRAQVSAAMEYLCDDDIDPLYSERKLFLPYGFGAENR